jgi:hypothetical protein
MVGRGDDHGVDLLILQDPAQVLFCMRLAPLVLGKQFLRDREEVFINIAHVSNLDILEGG